MKWNRLFHILALGAVTAMTVTTVFPSAAYAAETAVSEDDSALQSLFEYSTGNEKGKYYGVDNGSTLLLAFRSYLDKTGTGASYYEIVYDRAIVFHKK